MAKSIHWCFPSKLVHVCITFGFLISVQSKISYIYINNVHFTFSCLVSHSGQWSWNFVTFNWAVKCTRTLTTYKLCCSLFNSNLFHFTHFTEAYRSSKYSTNILYNLLYMYMYVKILTYAFIINHSAQCTCNCILMYVYVLECVITRIKTTNFIIQTRLISIVLHKWSRKFYQVRTELLGCISTRP